MLREKIQNWYRESITNPERQNSTIMMVEKYLIALYEPHFNDIDNPTPRKLASKYDEFCESNCPVCLKQRLKVYKGLHRNITGESRGRKGVKTKAEKYSLCPPVDFVDRLCYEISCRPDMIAQGYTQSSSNHLMNYLSTKGAFVKHRGNENSTIYTIIPSDAKRIKSFTMEVVRSGFVYKHAVDQREKPRMDELIRISPIDLRYSHLPFLSIFDQFIHNAYMKLYVYHDRSEVFYIGKSGAPRTRLHAHLRSEIEAFKKFVDYCQSTNQPLYMSLLSLHDCEPLYVNSVLLRVEDK